MTEAIIAQEMKFGDQIPSGTYLDMAVNLPLVDPKKVRSPVLMIRGEHDGNSTNEDLLEFFRELPNGDRQFVILPHTAHSIGYSNNRHLLYYAVKNFLAAPAACGVAASVRLITRRARVMTTREDAMRGRVVAMHCLICTPSPTLPQGGGSRPSVLPHRWPLHRPRHVVHWLRPARAQLPRSRTSRSRSAARR